MIRKRSRTVRRGAVRKVSTCIAIDAGQLANGLPYLASVLKSPVAIQASIAVVKAFVRIRQLLTTHKDLAKKLEELEKKYDAQFRVVFDAIRGLMNPAATRLIPSAQPMKRVKGFKND